jgi:hypothetical protein
MIDAVLTWVDGNDPAMKAKQARYMAFKCADKLDDVAGPARFVQSNEIFYAVASILRFAPYVGRIFIVTDNQNPHLDEFVKRNFPDSKVPLIILDHRDIFKGYEEYLPVFNSRSIETMLWRIPDLSEQFIFLNDDFFFASPSRIEDFFRDGKVVCYSHYYPVLAEEIIRLSHRKRNGHRRASYKDSLMNAAKMVGSHRFLTLQHTPKAMLRSIYEDYYDRHPEAIVRNLKHKFRHDDQYNVPGLFFLLARNRNLMIRENPDRCLLMVRQMRDKKDYFRKKLEWADNDPYLKFGCINALQDASPKEMEMFKEWIARRLNIVFVSK